MEQLVAGASLGPGVREARDAIRGLSLIVALTSTASLTDAVVPAPAAQAESSPKGAFAFTGAISGTVVVTARVCSRQLVPDLPGAFFNFVWPTGDLAGSQGWRRLAHCRERQRVRAGEVGQSFVRCGHMGVISRKVSPRRRDARTPTSAPVPRQWPHNRKTEGFGSLISPGQQLKMP